jgi:hypothetical protein
VLPAGVPDRATDFLGLNAEGGADDSTDIRVSYVRCMKIAMAASFTL